MAFPVPSFTPFGIDPGFEAAWQRVLESWNAGLADRSRAPVVHDLDDAYVVEVAVPGMRRRDLDVEIAGRRVRVTGERRGRRRLAFWRRPSAVERVHVEVVVPGAVEADGCRADLVDGVLRVRLAKPARDRRVRIPVR